MKGYLFCYFDQLVKSDPLTIVNHSVLFKLPQCNWPILNLYKIITTSTGIVIFLSTDYRL